MSHSSRFTRVLALAIAGASPMTAALAQAPQNAERCPATLPAPVAATAEALRAAARANDYAALRRLVKRPVDFAWGYGGEGDPTPEWQRAKREGHDPAAMLLALLAMPCIVQRTDGRIHYHWPAATNFAWSALTPAERAPLEKLYGSAIDKAWQGGRSGGYYAGWRTTILSDGTWTAFMMPQ